MALSLISGFLSNFLPYAPVPPPFLGSEEEGTEAVDRLAVSVSAMDIDSTPVSTPAATPLQDKVVSKDKDKPVSSIVVASLSSDILGLFGAFACSNIQDYHAFLLTCKAFKNCRDRAFIGNSKLTNEFIRRFGGLPRYVTPAPGCFFGKIPQTELGFIQKHALSLRSLSCDSVPDLQVTQDIVTTFKNLQKLKFYSNSIDKVGEGSFSKLALLPLQELEINGCGAVFFKDIAAISTLQKLTLSIGQIDDPRDVARLTNLISLDLSGSRDNGSSAIGDAIAPFLVKMVHLQSLNLAHANVSDKGLEAVGKITTLTALSLFDCQAITDQGISSLNGLAHLREVGLAHTKVTNQAICALGTRKIVKLNLHSCKNISSDVLEGLQHIASLEDLSVARTTETGAGGILRDIEKATNLTQLDISGIKDICEGILHLRIDAITKLRKLRVLSVSDTGIHDDQLAKISKMTSLTSLDLSALPITDKGVAQISHLPLRELRLTWTAITDPALATVARCRSLESLYLTFCKNITDAGLVPLAQLSNLTYLGVGECAKLTRGGVTQLHESLPQCAIMSSLPKQKVKKEVMKAGRQT